MQIATTIIMAVFGVSFIICSILLFVYAHKLGKWQEIYSYLENAKYLCQRAKQDLEFIHHRGRLEDKNKELEAKIDLLADKVAQRLDKNKKTK